MKISVVIPTLNEEKNIDLLIDRFVEVNKILLRENNSLELVFVDDRSEDKTAMKIKNRQKEDDIKIFLLERQERGLSTAVIAGFKLCKGDVWGVMDADLSHPPKVILKMLPKLKSADLVLGTRYINGGDVEKWPFYRRWMSIAGSMTTRIIGVKVSDPMSGLFFFKPKVIEDIELNPIGYKILLEILVKSKDCKVGEVSYVFTNRNHGESKIGVKETFNYFRHLGRLFVWRMRDRG